MGVRPAPTSSANSSCKLKPGTEYSFAPEIGAGQQANSGVLRIRDHPAHQLVIPLPSRDKLRRTPTLVGRLCFPVFEKYLRVESRPLIIDECRIGVVRVPPAYYATSDHSQVPLRAKRANSAMHFWRL